MNQSVTASFRVQIGPLLLLTGIFFLNFLSRIVLSPLMPSVERDLGISHAQAGSLFFFISTGYFVSLLGAGFVSARLTHRKTILVSGVGVGVTLLAVGLADSFGAIQCSFLVLGLATGLYLPSGIATLTSLAEPGHWGKSMAIHELAPNVSFVAAPLIAEVLLRWFSWRAILGIMGGASLSAALAFALWGKGGEFLSEPPRFRTVRLLLQDRRFWIMVGLFSLAIAGSMGIYAMLPLYLVAEQGIHRDWTNTLVALSRVSGLAVGFVAGWATDRFSPPKILAIVFLSSGLATVLLGATRGVAVLVFVFVQPMLAVSFFPPGFAALSTVGPSNARNIAVSLTVPVAFLLGGGAVPAAIGFAGDAGSFGLGIALVGGMIFSGFFLSLALRRSSR